MTSLSSLGFRIPSIPSFMIFKAPSSSPSSSSAIVSTADHITNVVTLDKNKKDSPQKDNHKSTTSPKQEDATIDKSVKQEQKTTSDASQPPLGPPPRPVPAEQQNSDYFGLAHKTHHTSEPNPFEQSFGNPSVDTPGKSLLPPVASLTSPAPLGTGGASLTGGFGWGGCLRSGPLSPAMLSGPQGDYFDNIRSYPTPNESSLRTGLTPGGGGSMFPAPSPGTQALFNSFASAGATPSTLEFGRAANNVTTLPKPEQLAATSAPGIQAQTATMNASNLAHPDNEAANGLFMLAQASGAPQQNGFTAQNGIARSHTKNNGSISAASQAQDDMSDDNKSTRKSKRASAGKNSRRKTDDTPMKQPSAKKAKANNGAPAMAMSASPDMDDMDDDDDMDMDEGMPKDTKKMTDEEKRKNFLERNRVAALKCRQRKKQWLQNLQSKVEIYSSENDALNAQVSALRDEVLNLKTILIAHKDCPIAQQQSTQQGYIGQNHVDYNNAPYGMSMQQQQQAVGMQRRFS